MGIIKSLGWENVNSKSFHPLQCHRKIASESICKMDSEIATRFAMKLIKCSVQIG